MALPSSGAISFGSIAGEMGITAANNLSYLSQYAGNSSGYVPGGLTSSPYAMGEFFGFGFQSLSFTEYCFMTGPGYGQTSLFYGSNGLWYYGPSTGSGVVDGWYYQYYGFDYWSYQYQYTQVYFGSGYANVYGTVNSQNNSPCLEIAPI